MENMKLMTLCEGMSKMAATYPNDTISNALARVSYKIETMSSSKFAPQLDDLDKKVIKFYLTEKNKSSVTSSNT